MKFAVFSDIHGNIYALRAMLNQLKDSDIMGYIFCGDIMGYFPHQKQVIECLEKIPNLYSVMGNHDFYYINSRNDHRKQMLYVKQYGRNYLNILTDSQLRYLTNLPAMQKFQYKETKVLVVHGAVGNCLEGRIYPDTSIRWEQYKMYNLVILGHTHYRMYAKNGETVVINPGSLGQPRDSNGYSYCVVDVETQKAEFLKVEIDENQLLKDLVDNGEDKTLISYLKSKMEGI